MRSGRESRRGATLVETLVAGAVALVVLAGAWFVFGSARRATDQALRYGSVLQTAASITAHLRLDLAAVAVPIGADGGLEAVEISADGKTVGFMRDARSDSLDAVPPSGPPPRWVEWTAEPGPEGGEILVRRTLDGESLRWPGALLRDLRFRIVLHRQDVWVVAEMLLAPEAPPQSGGTATRELPVRVVQRMRPPQILPRFPGVGYPEALLGELAPPAAPPPPLIEPGGLDLPIPGGLP